MSHPVQTFVSGPTSLGLSTEALERAAEAGGIRFIVVGQATVVVRLAHKQPFEVCFADPKAWGAPALKWCVDRRDVSLHLRQDGVWTEVARFFRKTLGFAGQDYTPAGGLAGAPGGAVEIPDAEMGLDSDPSCTYWFSFDQQHREVLYGKGELRRSAALATHGFSAAERTATAWMRGVGSLTISPTAAVKHVEVWRDPVCVEPPLKVVSADAITMEQVAMGTHTVPANLSPECRALHDNVAGRAFRLDDDKFPHFGDAIEESIKTPTGWCYKKLREKAAKSGVPLERTYLRITLGRAQGESPGVPFVMEIWPPNHYSPVHNHGGAHAVIRVLRGEITVKLYRMLSDHFTEWFMKARFAEGDITWLTPGLNQNHKLKNKGDKTCVTIQCYAYPRDSDEHYPYFDYLKGAGQPLGHFDPDSDMDFLEFKRLMHDEWLQRPAAASDGPPAAGHRGE
jgi:uncharacterized cupin superfamily protein